MTGDLFPNEKPKRRMLQPTKAVLRQRLADAEAAAVAERERADYWRNVARYASDPGVNAWLQTQQDDGAPLDELAVRERWAAAYGASREPNPITSLLNRLFRRAA